MTPLGRSDRTHLGRWYWTIDRPLLMIVLVLIAIGLIAVAAASPAAAHRYSGENFTFPELFFFKRQLFWVSLGLPVMLAISMLSAQWAKRMALLGTLLFIAALAAVPFFGHEVNGAVRWFKIGGSQFQPSEFLKPLFVITTAWIMSSRFEDSEVPAIGVAFGLLALVVSFLVFQPDYGQSALFVAVWLVQAFIAGMSLAIVFAVVMVALAGLGLAYQFVPHVASRIDRYWTGGGDTYQVDKALEGFRSGGLFGAGPGEGQNKFSLPEPHTDYIFSVIGEEFGVIACAGIAILFVVMVARVLLQLLDEEDPFILLASAGLVAQIGGQAMINIGVNLDLLPSKGMTLPFVSHGGSSFIALSMAMGLLLALTRRNRFLNSSPYLERAGAMS